MAMWSSGALASRLAKVAVAADVNVTAALSEVAARIEREAKDRVRAAGSHPAGTPTPAVKGGAPAIITGTLRRSIVHTRPRPVGAFTWECRVGMAAPSRGCPRVRPTRKRDRGLLSAPASTDGGERE